MKTLYSVISLATLFSFSKIGFSQFYPSYGPPIDVTINGLTFDAMEPFISNDGNTLFFNNLNDGINTKLYYAAKVDDSTFTYVGEVNGANELSPPQLNAVADLDENGYFVWTTARDYPANYDNLFHGDYAGGSVSNIGRIHGDFYVYSPGWILMDHGISKDGQYLYYNNAFFDTCQGPCETFLGIAQKVNDSTFNKISTSDAIMTNINDTNYVYYAPCITSDNLELYYTRFPKGTLTPTTPFDVLVALRDTPTDTFSIPSVLFTDVVATIVEAPTLTDDKLLMYYHQKVAGTHVIKLRYRIYFTDNEKTVATTIKRIYPNPMQSSSVVNFEYVEGHNYQINLINIQGQLIRKYENVASGSIQIERDDLTAGIYHLQLMDGTLLVDAQKLIVK